jgi:hypothetical protein
VITIINIDVKHQRQTSTLNIKLDWIPKKMETLISFPTYSSNKGNCCILTPDPINIVCNKLFVTNYHVEDKIIDEFPGITKIRKNLDNINELSYDELLNLKELLSDLQMYYCKRINHPCLHMGAYYQFGTPIEKEINLCAKKIKNKSLSKYYKNTQIIFTPDTYVNGYKLFDCKENIFDEQQFNQLNDKWNDKTMDYSKFSDLYEKDACSEWAKQDRYGNCFGGFWKYPEGSDEKKNAYNLSREDNCKGLYELPYPKEFILETIEIGCNSRLESVRYSNFLCEWYKQKLIKLKEDESEDESDDEDEDESEDESDDEDED